MKTIYKIQIQLIVALIVLVSQSCDNEDFLDRFPLDSPNPENFFVDATTARLAVNACYDPWQYGNSTMLLRDMTILLDAMSDDSYWRTNRSTSIALEMWNISPTHTNVRNWWRYAYESINAANFAIDNIPLSSDPNFNTGMQAPYIGEATFLRGYSYLFLVNFYGGVPLFTEAASDFKEFHTGRSTKEEVLAQVIQDFTFAKENLPESQPDKGAPTKASAAAFLAKAYLYVEDWAKAESAAREAIQIAESSGYALQDDYLSIWSDEGNSELLFYWSFVENDQQYGQNMTVQRLCRDLPSTLRVAINGDGWGYSLPQRDLYDAFEEGDPRREFTIYSPGKDYEIYPGPDDFTYTHERYNDLGQKETWDVTYKPGDMVEYDYRWSPTGMNVRKMIRSVKEIANARWSGLDIPVMRLAELYLILGEALAEQGKAEALDWVNKVRSRASVDMPDKTTADGGLVELVRHERRVELAMEGLRIFDLIRWGNIDDVFGNGQNVQRHYHSEFLDVSSSLKYDSPIGNLSLDPLFPIPQEEIDQNTQINQNNAGW